MTKAQLIKNLQEMDYQLGNLIAKLEKQNRKGSDVLYYSKNKGYGAFYKSDGKTRTYLSKDRHNEIADLANKTYQIQYGMTVQEIKVEDGRVREVVAVDETGTASAFACDVVISSMPLKDLIAGMNGVPEEVSAIAAGLPYRDFVTVGILVKRINLKNQTKLATLGNIIPDCWIYVQNTDVKLGRIQVFNNWSPYLLEDPENTVWLGLEYFCAEGDEFWRKSEEEWVRLGAGELVKMGVLAEGEAVLDFHVEKVPKAYPAYFDTYSQIDRLTAYLNSISNLYCVGRNGQHRYNNMDHSMVTAFEAVKCLLAGGGDKTAIWQVNTEQEYHEEKKA